MSQADPVSKLIFELSKLPGVGEKTATRLAYHILKQESAYAENLASAVLGAKSATQLCSVCCTFTNLETCVICANPVRQTSLICVVERPSDVLAIEQANANPGLYHVLHGSLSPLDGIGPDELKIRELLARINRGGSALQEIILATNPSVEGEATALYLTRLLKPMGIKITRLAHGLPVGGLIEYTDRQTLGKAIQHRVEMT